jgi:hypothetical protein
LAENLDPGGAPVTVGNVTLITPGLTGVADTYLPGTPGMRAAESATETLDAALAEERVEPQETVALTETQEVDVGVAQTRSTSYDEPAIQLEAPDPGDGWGQVVLAVDESGALTWNFGLSREDAKPLRGGGDGSRVYLIRRYVPPPDDAGPVTRGLIGAIGTKILKILAFKLLDAAAGEVSDYFVGRWEQKKRPYGVRPFGPENYSSPSVERLDGDGWARVSDGRALLFVHGTFSQAHSAFGCLPRDFVAELAHRYEGRVFAFDHFTLSHDPRQNVERFISCVPANAKLDLDVVCHSRGGLVTRVLAERQSELALGSRSVAIRTVAFVGTPNAGTVLADAKRFGDLVDTYTNLLNFFPDTGATDVLQTVIAVVKQLAVGAFKGLDGLESMVPGGRFLSQLNVQGGAAPGYHAVTSDFEPQSAGLKGWFADRLADAVFKADNDLVVPTAGVYASNGSHRFPIGEPELLTGAAAVGHTRYFSSDPVLEKLREWLVPSPGT